MTWTNWNDNYVFRTGGTDRLFTLASGGAAVALRAQGMEVTKSVAAGMMGFTNSSDVVTYSSAASGHSGEILVCSSYFFPYRIVSVSVGVSYTLDRVFTGVTGSYSAIVFPGPATGVPALNPQSGVVGRAEDQRIPIEGTVITSASEVAVTLVVA